jgi:peptide/nickel transport system permease protein
VASLIGFALRRLAQAVAVMLAVAFIAFVLFQYVGDPVAQLAGPDATPEQRAALRTDLGLDRPVVVQFARFAGHAVRGDFGISLRQGRAVSRLLLERLPATLELAVVAAVLGSLAGIPAGVYAALHCERRVAHWLMGLSLLGVSLPTFVVGILLIYVFSVQLGWLPSFGRGNVVALGGGWTSGLFTVDGWRHIALPAVTLATFQLALTLRLARAEMLDVLRSGYIRFARARGLPERTIHFRHALRNALMPVITVTGLQFGSLVAFSVVTETVFQWPGMGLLFIQAVAHADIPVMAAYLCVVALVFVSINWIVDVLYVVVDPRLRYAAAR